MVNLHQEMEASFAGKACSPAAFILARAPTSSHKNVLPSPFYSPSSIFSFLPNTVPSPPPF